MQLYPDPSHRPFKLGSGRAGALLIHGFPGTPAEMRPLGEKLAAAGYTSHGLLLPGFGAQIDQLAQKRRHDWLAAARDAWQTIRRRHTPRVLVGYSMGSALALHLAHAHPADYLILLSPFWRMSHWLGGLLPILKYFKPTVAPFEQADFDDPELRAQLREIMPGVDLDAPEVQAQLRIEIVLPTAVLDEVRRLGSRAYRLAAKVQTPTLVIQGNHDQTVLPAHTQKLVERLPHVTYYRIPGAHTFPKTDSNFWRIVLDFLPEPIPHARQT